MLFDSVLSSKSIEALNKSKVMNYYLFNSSNELPDRPVDSIEIVSSQEITLLKVPICNNLKITCPSIRLAGIELGASTLIIAKNVVLMKCNNVETMMIDSCDNAILVDIPTLKRLDTEGITSISGCSNLRDITSDTLFFSETIDLEYIEISRFEQCNDLVRQSTSTAKTIIIKDSCVSKLNTYNMRNLGLFNVTGIGIDDIKSLASWYLLTLIKR